MGDETNRLNHCLDCGACCVNFRVSFYWAEADDFLEGGVPVGKTVKVDNFRRAMRWLGPQERRCVALRGEPGQKVQCMIYNQRPSVCRGFEPSWKTGNHNPACDHARELIGLDSLSPDSWSG
ncbi:MAG TPA: YkgJ family cysteine cluster protein [Smithella sp.]|nr:YkgJ family cysteine cluster protein [Smithella sp.]